MVSGLEGLFVLCFEVSDSLSHLSSRLVVSCFSFFLCWFGRARSIPSYLLHTLGSFSSASFLFARIGPPHRSRSVHLFAFH
jgi:hypothetical protein